MPLEPGTRVGPYEITGVLGHGGMGTVYRARDPRLGRDVAIKVVAEQLAGDPARARRMEQEARAASRLNHPGILSVFDVGAQDGVPYVVTELLEGESLRQVVEGGATPWRTVLPWAIAIAEGLAAAHEQGIVHRDVKPDNLFVTRDGRVKILDFGVATLVSPPDSGEIRGDAATVSQAGMLVGTVGYMSPEQARGQKVDARTDIFAFGCVVYELLSGRPAFGGATPVEVLAAIQRDTPQPLDEIVPGVRPAFARLVERCLDKDPSRRFQSARDLVFALSLLESGRLPPDEGALHREGAASSDAVPPARASERRGAVDRGPPRGLSTRRALLIGGAALLADTALTAALTRRRTPELAPAASAATTTAAPPLYRQLTFQRGTVYTARFTPDGSAIVYSAAWQGTARDLRVTVPGTRDSRSLGHPDTDVAFNFLDGQIAVIRRPPGGGAFRPGVLARMSLAGGPAKDLVDGVVWADGAPDGGDMVLVRTADADTVLELPPGRAIARARHIVLPRLSPDGKRVAYLDMTGEEDSGRVVVVDRAGARIFESELYASVEGVAWRSPGELWFTASREGRANSLYATDLQGRTRLVARAAGRLVLHDLDREGRVVAERNSTHAGILVGSGARGDERDLALLDLSTLAQLSRDGKQLLFSEAGGPGGGAGAYLRPLDGGPPLRIGDGQALALSPDGAQALLRVGLDPTHLELSPVGAGRPVSLPAGVVGNVTWARFAGPRRLVLLGREGGGRPRLYVLDTDGGGARPLTGEGAVFAGDCVSADGARAAGVVDGSAVLVNLDDGSTRALPGLEAAALPIGWSDDGKGLLVATSGRTRTTIERFDLATSKRAPWRTLEPADPAGLLGLGRVSVAAGGLCAYETYQLLSDLFLVENLV